MTAKLHLAEDTLTLHLFLESAERLIDVVIPDKNLHANSSYWSVSIVIKNNEARHAHLSLAGVDTRRSLACPGLPFKKSAGQV